MLISYINFFNIRLIKVKYIFLRKLIVERGRVNRKKIKFDLKENRLFNKNNLKNKIRL